MYYATHIKHVFFHFALCLFLKIFFVDLFKVIGQTTNARVLQMRHYSTVQNNGGNMDSVPLRHTLTPAMVLLLQKQAVIMDGITISQSNSPL